MKFVMAKTGTANINGHSFSWSEGEPITLSAYEKSVLTRGGYVGEAVEIEKVQPVIKLKAKKRV